jgi:acyl transferase domain-containing protein
MQELPGGSMLMVPLSEKEIQPFLGGKLSLAVINGPSLCVVSGEKEAVEELKGQLSHKKIDCRYLHTSHAFHSEMMEPIVNEFTEKVRQVGLKPPQIPFVSNVTGTWITPEEATSPSYWAKHLRHTVRFSDCLRELMKEPRRVFLEIGPGLTFSVLLNQQPNKTKEQIVLSSIRHPKDPKSDLAFILTTLGQIWLAGTEIDWAGFYAEESRYRLPLPTYPFERKRHWIDAGKQVFAVHSAMPTFSHELDEVSCSETMPPEQQKGSVYDRVSEDDMEQIIVNVWQEILGIDEISIHDNFFELGGNSLTALRMLSQLETVLGKKLPLSLFKAPTVKQLVNFISKEEGILR